MPCTLGAEDKNENVQIYDGPIFLKKSINFEKLEEIPKFTGVFLFLKYATCKYIHSILCKLAWIGAA